MKLPVEPVTYDRSEVSIGIVHFGVGNFHRSHQAMYIDRLLRNPETFQATKEFGICGVGVLPTDARMRDALREQDFEYTLVERHPDGSAPATRIGSIVGYLFAPEELEEVLERLANPATRIVSLTITEGGYNISDSTGEFDTQNPSVVADSVSGAVPSTVFGIIVAGLSRRRKRGIPPFAIMSCDNIEGNGHVARKSLSAFAHLVNPELGEWIEATVRFPSSMVDRITPVTTDVDREWVLEQYGVVDAWPVLSEDFVQWVLEDNFGTAGDDGGRPPYERAGVQLVEDVRPYELMKLRLLNASHQAIAFSGLLAGYEFVHEAAADHAIIGLIRSYMDREATPTLEPVPGIDLDAYKDRLIERFSSPYVRDTLARLATDASDRIPKFLVPVIRQLRSTGSAAPLSASVIAAWATYAERYFAGADLPFLDRQEAAIRAGVARQESDESGFLRNPDWFGSLVDDETFAAEYIEALISLRAASDPRPTLEQLVR